MSIYQQPLEWIKEAVESVEAQDYRNWQLLIRLDGPKAIVRDGEIWLKSLATQHPQINILAGEKRLGTFGSYRVIFNQAKANYLVQLDADDTIQPDGLGKAFQVISKHQASPFVYTQCNLIANNGTRLSLDQRSLIPWHKDADLVQFITFHMRLIRRTAYLEVGGYDKEFHFAGDYDLCLKLAELGEPKHLPEPLYNYRLHSNSESQRQREATHQEALKAAREALKRRQLDSDYALIHSLDSEIITLTKRSNPPVVVAGMHRSGTSLLARMLTSLGVSFGKNLLSQDYDNPEGYQEDIAFLKLHRNWFASSLEDDEDGWLDGGWNQNQSISSLGKARWKGQAEELLKIRENSAGDDQWGWKDPRTTLLLPFWRHLRPELNLIGIYRAPWDISDALQRVRRPHGQQFRDHPEITHSLWKIYNQRLLEYLEAEPVRSVLLHAESLANHSEKLLSILQNRWDWRIHEQFRENYSKVPIRKNRLLSIRLPDPIETLYSLVYPDLTRLWLQLQNKADLLNTDASKNDNYIPLLNMNEVKNYVLCIVIPTSNPSHHLIEAIASVERYRDPNRDIEITIIDNASTKSSSLEILEKLDMIGYKVIRSHNSGLAASLNTGIEASNAELFIPLNDNNRLLAPYLNQGLGYMCKHLEIDLYFGDRIDFGASNQYFRPGPLNEEELVKAIRIDPCAIIRRSLWSKCGGYDENLKALESWDLLLSGLRSGIKSYYDPQPCFESRVIKF
ncbi:Chondroitin synthase [Prochlorococcus marinus str. MIT 1313]|nr:glycosyltransferase [Prochlorococcus marinus]KZR68007.1 Chondroitin synthase [Prochlorococcus marinus str. MIT 1313]KZR78456.1 Chondroitin synthase [Prochlorococcus marinus str. MIT 1318]